MDRRALDKPLSLLIDTSTHLGGPTFERSTIYGAVKYFWANMYSIEWEIKNGKKHDASALPRLLFLISWNARVKCEPVHCRLCWLLLSTDASGLKETPENLKGWLRLSSCDWTTDISTPIERTASFRVVLHTAARQMTWLQNLCWNNGSYTVPNALIWLWLPHFGCFFQHACLKTKSFSVIDELPSVLGIYTWSSQIYIELSLRRPTWATNPFADSHKHRCENSSESPHESLN